MDTPTMDRSSIIGLVLGMNIVSILASQNITTLQGDKLLAAVASASRVGFSIGLRLALTKSDYAADLLEEQGAEDAEEEAELVSKIEELVAEGRKMLNEAVANINTGNAVGEKGKARGR